MRATRHTLRTAMLVAGVALLAALAGFGLTVAGDGTSSSGLLD